jgi:PIN domain nuclease of toxin-antitoxin system
MTYLLDTHIIVWALTDTAKLSRTVTEILKDPTNRILVSTISFWEISLKYSLDKLEIHSLEPEDFLVACKKTGYEIISVSPEEASTYHQIPAHHHRDPFDRMLIWQALNGGYTLISADQEVLKYADSGLRIIK